MHKKYRPPLLHTIDFRPESRFCEICNDLCVKEVGFPEPFFTCDHCSQSYAHDYCVGIGHRGWKCNQCLFDIERAKVLSLSVDKTALGREYKVKDISAATVNIGRNEIKLAELGMETLMACRRHFCSLRPLAGARISIALPINAQSAVLVETLTVLGATVRCCSSKRAVHNSVAAALAMDTASVFGWDWESPYEYWWCVSRCLDWGPAGGPHLILEGDDLLTLIEYGVMFEERFESNGLLPDPQKYDDVRRKFKYSSRSSRMLPDNEEFYNERLRYIISVLEDSMIENPRKYHCIKECLLGVTIKDYAESKYFQLMKDCPISFSILSVSETVVKKMIAPIYSCREYFLCSLMNATDNMVAGKIVVICGYGNVGQTCAATAKQAGARVIVTEVDPFRALRAAFDGFQVATLEEFVRKADIFVVATGNKDVVLKDLFVEMKNKCIICYMGGSGEVKGLGYLNKVEDLSQQNHVTRVVFPETSWERPSFLESWYLTMQVYRLFDIWKNPNSYEKRHHECTRKTVEDVAALYVGLLGGKLTTLESI